MALDALSLNALGKYSATAPNIIVTAAKGAIKINSLSSNNLLL
jgi:hypothetical protein